MRKVPVNSGAWSMLTANLLNSKSCTLLVFQTLRTNRSGTYRRKPGRTQGACILLEKTNGADPVRASEIKQNNPDNVGQVTRPSYTTHFLSNA